MNNRIWIVYTCISICTFYSCDRLIVKKDKREEVLKEKWNEIDQHKVEKPPLFDTCRDESEELDDCFHRTINEHINNYLSEYTITVKESINDTIWIPLLITKQGEIILEDFLIPDIIASQSPGFKNILKESVDRLPDVDPAHTHSTPVATRYKLPLVIRIN